MLHINFRLFNKEMAIHTLSANIILWKRLTVLKRSKWRDFPYFFINNRVFPPYFWYTSVMLSIFPHFRFIRFFTRILITTTMLKSNVNTFHIPRKKAAWLSFGFSNYRGHQCGLYLTVLGTGIDTVPTRSWRVGMTPTFLFTISPSRNRKLYK